MNKADAFEFYRRLAEGDPSPQTELEFVNPYTLLVAVALSAQATDVSVNKATRALFAHVTTPQAMLDLGEAALKDHIKTIGLFNTKAKNVIAAARILVDRHKGVVPAERDILETLPGVGRKTANVVLTIEFDLLALHRITSVHLFGDSVGGWVSENFDVEYKSTSAEVYKVANYSVPAKKNAWIDLPQSSLSARYIRIRIRGAAGLTSVQARELKIMGYQQ